MSRSNPNVDLNWCESHVIIKAVLADGTVLRLGTATLANVLESDGNEYQYIAKLTKDSELRSSITQATNQLSVGAENVDKVLGLSINNINTVLSGAKVIASKVFSNAYNMNIGEYNPKLWFSARTIKNVAPNQIVNGWTNASDGEPNATGTAILRWAKIDGKNALEFNSARTMNITDNFPLAQVFAVFKLPETNFSDSGSILGSSVPAFKFSSGTNNFTSPLPSSVRANGTELSSPYSVPNLSTTQILNVKTSNPESIRSYSINNQDGVRMNFFLSELIGFTTLLSPQEEQTVEFILSNTYGIQLPYIPSRTWESKVLLVGEIAKAEIDEGTVDINIVSDIAPNVAFLANRPLQSHCPLVYKGRACGYSGPLATCNKLYDSIDGCSGRNNQHRFGGLVIKGELPSPIVGGIDTTIGIEGRFGTDEHFPTMPRNREVSI